MQVKGAIASDRRVEGAASCSTKKFLTRIGVLLFLILSFYIASFLARTVPTNPPTPTEATMPASIPSLSSSGPSPFYALRTPTAYSIERQPVTVYGTIGSLDQENTVMLFRRDLTGVSNGSTYVIYTLSTAGIAVDADYTLVLNWEAFGNGIITGYIIATHIKIAILRQGNEWVPIHNVSTPEDRIDRSFGWAEYVIPAPYSDYLAHNEVKLKIELTQQLTAPRTWTQLLYVRWVFLELRKEVALNRVNAIHITQLSEGFVQVGTVDAVHSEDGTCFALQRDVDASGEKGAVLFLVEFDLGYLAQETLLGLRFSHLDWFQVEGSLGYSVTGNISLVGASTNTYLCYIRQNLDNPATPHQLHAIFPTLGDWKLGTKIQLLYNINYTVSGCAKLYAKVDWATIHIIRAPNPIVFSQLFNQTLRVQQEVWLNISCFNGKAPITEIRLAPWGDLIATAEGFYLYARSITTVGQISLYLTVRDADQTNYTFLVGTLVVLPSEEFLAVSGSTIIMLLLMVGGCILILWWQRSHSRIKVQRIVKRITKIIGVR